MKYRGFAGCALLLLGATGVALWLTQTQEPSSEHRTEDAPGEAKLPERTETEERPELFVQAQGRSNTVRRLKDKAQREQLLSLIKASSRARREARLSAAEGEQDTDTSRREGSLDKEVISKAVQAVIGDVAACYEKALKSSPRLFGQLVVEFEIIAEPGAGGIIDSAKLHEETDDLLRRNEELTECFLDAIYSIELEAPKDGGRVVVTYPFHLRPDDESTDSP